MNEDDGFRQLIGIPNELIKCVSCGKLSWYCTCSVPVSDPIEDLMFAFDIIRFGQRDAEAVRELRFKLGVAP